MQPKLSRRQLMAGAGIAAAAAEAAPREAAKPAPIWSREYTAKKTGKTGEVSLAMFRKRRAAPKAGEAPLPVLFLVHGSSISSRNSFDLTIPGQGERGEYSVMNTFAGWGFDVWTMDHENYGRSSRTSGNSDIASGVEDLRAGIDLALRETGARKVHMCGESSGALRAGAYAMVEPDRVDRLVFAAFTYKGEGSPTLAERAKQLDYYRTHNLRLRDRAMIRSIFTRDKPGTSDPAIAEYLADQELKFGDQVPTGTYLDMTAHLPVVDPAKVLAPVLLVRGEYDGIATVNDLSEFFKQLPNGDRQFSILPGMAHSVVLGRNRRIFWHAMRAFLTMPGTEVS
ncbi:MAG TPA: alpha/beta fold hydrolase [Bryobacteraceae bacterium]|nr:alpha/beta fold hydrolase [Bryobacteraceae bacterium]